MTFPPLAAIVGAESSGKDEAADFYVRTYGAAKYSSGDPIKNSFAILYCDGLTQQEIKHALWTHEGKASEHPYLMGWFKGGTRRLAGFEHDRVGLEAYIEAHTPYRFGLDSLRAQDVLKQLQFELKPVLFREGLEVHGDKILALDPLAVMRPMGALARKLAVTDTAAEIKARQIVGENIDHIYRPLVAGTVVFDVATREDRQTEYIKAGVEGLGEGVVIYVQNRSAEAARTTTHHTADFYARTPHDFVVVNDPAENTLAEYHSRLVTLWALLQLGARSGTVGADGVTSDLDPSSHTLALSAGAIYLSRATTT